MVSTAKLDIIDDIAGASAVVFASSRFSKDYKTESILEVDLAAVSSLAVGIKSLS
jgi:hypothetical protein